MESDGDRDARHAGEVGVTACRRLGPSGRAGPEGRASMGALNRGCWRWDRRPSDQVDLGEHGREFAADCGPYTVGTDQSQRGVKSSELKQGAGGGRDVVDDDLSGTSCRELRHADTDGSGGGASAGEVFNAISRVSANVASAASQVAVTSGSRSSQNGVRTIPIRRSRPSPGYKPLANSASVRIRASVLSRAKTPGADSEEFAPE